MVFIAEFDNYLKICLSPISFERIDWFENAITISKYKFHTELNKNLATNDVRLYFVAGVPLTNV
jgi:hypothetical protein